MRTAKTPLSLVVSLLVALTPTGPRWGNRQHRRPTQVGRLLGKTYRIYEGDREILPTLPTVGDTREHPGGPVGRVGRVYSSTPPPVAIWPMRKMTNSAGLTGASPISTTSWPASMTSGGLVSSSHLT